MSEGGEEESRTTPRVLQVYLGGEETPSQTINTAWSRRGWAQSMLENEGDTSIHLFDPAHDEWGCECTKEDVRVTLEFLHLAATAASSGGPVTPRAPWADALETLGYAFSILRGADFMQIDEELYLDVVHRMLRVVVPRLLKHPPTVAEPLLLTSVSAGQRVFDRLGTYHVLRLMQAGLALVGHRGAIDARDKRIDDELLGALVQPDLPSKVEELNASGNENITTVAVFGASLLKLDASETCGIGDSGLKASTSLVDLNLRNNERVGTVEPFAASLRRLNASGQKCVMTDEGGLCVMSDEGLENAIGIVELDAGCNPGITTVFPFRHSLKVLSAEGESGIDDAGLAEATRIEKLNVNSNPNVSSVQPFASTLKELFASCPLRKRSGINDSSLVNAHHIEVFDCSMNPGITTVAPFAATLKRLDAAGSRIDDAGLKHATCLEDLEASGCPEITTVKPFGASLRVLGMVGNCGITDAGLATATRIENLFLNGQYQITTVAPFAATLKVLTAGLSGIDDEGLKLATSIEELDVDGNTAITTVAPFAASLKKLSAEGCGIDDAGLATATSIEELHATENPNITTVAPFAATLKDLDAAENCGIGDAGLATATRIERLDSSFNPKITRCTPFASTLKRVVANGAATGLGDAGLADATELEELFAAENFGITTVRPFENSLKTIECRHLVSDALSHTPFLLHGKPELRKRSRDYDMEFSEDEPDSDAD